MRKYFLYSRVKPVFLNIFFFKHFILKNTNKTFISSRKMEITGLEPATFRLTAERANRLRHRSYERFAFIAYLLVYSIFIKKHDVSLLVPYRP